MTAMRRRLEVIVVGVLLPAASLGAQRPNLSGDWVRSDSATARSVAATGDAAFRRGDMGIGWGANVTIEQRPDSLVVLYDFFSTDDLQPRVRFAYAMDGSESRNGVMIGHAQSVQHARLSWQGSALVITTTHPLPNAAGRSGVAEVRQTVTLESPNALVVETVRPAVLGGAASTTRAVYTRK